MKLRFFAIWFAAVTAFGGASTFMPGFAEWILLDHDHAATTGVVLSADRNNHLSATVRFTASGKVFEQGISGCDCRVGSSVVVYYYPHDPSIASVRTPEESHRLNLSFIVWGSIFGGLWVARGWVYLVRKRPEHIAKGWRADAKFFSILLLLGAFLGGTGCFRAGLFKGWALASIPLVVGGMTLLVMRIWRVPRGATAH
jgi:hypothetical protein